MDRRAAGREGGDGADSERERAGWKAAGRGEGARAKALATMRFVLFAQGAAGFPLLKGGGGQSVGVRC